MTPSLLHALVAADTTVLAEAHGPTISHDPEQGSQFSQATSTILSKIPPNNSKLSYQLEDYLCHYIRQDGVTVMVMADQDCPRRIAFGFLNELLKRFTTSFGADEIADAPPYGMASFNSTISSLMTTFTTNPPADPVRQAQEEIAGVKAIMVQNVEQILSRGERIELLVDKTDHMSTQAKAFRKRSQAMRRKQWWKNMKLMVLTGFVVLILLLLLFSSIRPQKR